VAAGATLLFPSAHEMLPTPLSIEQLVAFVMPLHESVDESPLVIEAGAAPKDPIVGAAGAGAETVTVADIVALPPEPVAVSV
jgi:hypothetical protein